MGSFFGKNFYIFIEKYVEIKIKKNILIKSMQFRIFIM